MEKSTDSAVTQSKKARQAAFIAAFVTNKGSIGDACDEIGITRRTERNWMKETAFREQFDDAVDRMLDGLEVTLYKQALEDGELALKILERLRPEKWKPKKEEEKGFAGAITVKVTYTD